MSTNVKEYYDLLIDNGVDTFRDNDVLKSYMCRWDGPEFNKMLGATKEKTILEVGVGTGRIADRILKLGCKHYTGIDISSKTINRAKENLRSKYKNIDLLLKDINSFRAVNKFHIVFSVLTFIHIKEKELALEKMVNSLKVNGYIILSIDANKNIWLNNYKKIRVYPETPDYYCNYLQTLNCKIDKVVDLYDDFILPNGEKSAEFGKRVATLIKAIKVRP